MTFIASKVLWILLRPSTILVLLLVVGSLAMKPARRRWGRLLVGWCAAFLLAAAILPVGDWLIRPLESRFARPVPPPAAVDGIIVLGGAIDLDMSIAHGEPQLQTEADRLTAFVELGRRYPDARLVFTGGSGNVRDVGAMEAAFMRRFLDAQGFGTDRVVFEDRSRNTFENALMSKEIVRPHGGETWLLVTSASHMPRAVGVFRRAGWPVVPWPVDYQAPAGFVLAPRFDLPTQLFRIDKAAKEWVGLVAYYLMDRTDSPWPGPAAQP